MPGKAHRIGPYSRRTGLARLDARTSEGRFFRTVVAELEAHLGSRPTAPQRLLIKLAALKALRIALLAELVVTETAIEERDDRQLVAWMNGLRLDLQALGLARPERDAPSLATYLSKRGRAA